VVHCDLDKKKKKLTLILIGGNLPQEIKKGYNFITFIQLVTFVTEAMAMESGLKL